MIKEEQMIATLTEQFLTPAKALCGAYAYARRWDNEYKLEGEYNQDTGGFDATQILDKALHSVRKEARVFLDANNISFMDDDDYYPRFDWI
jgi:hypothetical protein